MPWKASLSVIAMVLTFAAFFPYFRSIFRGHTKPHVFSWVIWSVTTLIIFGAQWKEGGGAGSWPTGLSGLITVYIAVLGFQKRGDLSIKVLDWIFFAGALLSLPLWFWTSDPLASVVLLTMVDILGFGPTLRQAYANPYSEPISFFALFAIRNAISIVALERYSMTTILFPAAVGVGCLYLVAMVMWRRKTFSIAEKQP